MGGSRRRCSWTTCWRGFRWTGRGSGRHLPDLQRPSTFPTIHQKQQGRFRPRMGHPTAALGRAYPSRRAELRQPPNRHCQVTSPKPIPLEDLARRSALQLAVQRPGRTPIRRLGRRPLGRVQGRKPLQRQAAVLVLRPAVPDDHRPEPPSGSLQRARIALEVLFWCSPPGPPAWIARSSTASRSIRSRETAAGRRRYLDEPVLPRMFRAQGALAPPEHHAFDFPRHVPGAGAVQHDHRRGRPVRGFPLAMSMSRPRRAASSVSQTRRCPTA